jgi:hypothetical protein
MTEQLIEQLGDHYYVATSPLEFISDLRDILTLAPPKLITDIIYMLERYLKEHKEQ